MNMKALVATTLALLVTMGYLLPTPLPFTLPTVLAQHQTWDLAPPPRIQKYYFTTFNDPTSEFTALQGGTIDAMEWPLSSSQLTTLQANNKYQTNRSNDLGSVQVIFDAGRFPSNDTSYRQALSLMIDRNDIVATSLSGLGGGKMSDQLTPSWPSAYHVPGGGFNWDKNLAQANATLYAGGFRYNCKTSGGAASGCGGDPNGLGGNWFNIVNATNLVNHATTIFYSRSDDPLRLYIGVQVATMQGATKATYHFDRLFTVTPVPRFLAARTVYRSPQSGGGYTDNNCNGSGLPCFTAYTQDSSFGITDLSWMWSSFSTTYLDVPYQNFGHWVNATINSLAKSLFSDAVLNNTKVQLLNKAVTQTAWWDPIYYLQDWNGISERVTGHLSAANSPNPNGAFWFSNQDSYARAHLKGRLYGGSIRLGISNPLNQFNIFNSDSDWVYDAQVLGRIYDSLLSYDYDTVGLSAGIATSHSVSTFTGSIYNSRFQSGSPGWAASIFAPYWTKGANGYHTVSGTHISFTLLTNATWHDGSALTPNDIIWNAITAAMDRNNFETSAWSTLDDINATGNTVNMYFNATGYDTLTLAALTPMAPPRPWVFNRDWVAHNGIVSDISLNNKTSLNLSSALNMLDGSGSYQFDSDTTGDPFAVGSPFDLVANDNYFYRDPNKATYATGIADRTAYPSSPISPGTPINIQIALVNGQNALGDVFSGGNLVTDPATVSDTISGATVTAIVYENPADTVTLIYNSGDGLWEGALPTTGLTGGVYHVQITASKTGSISTTYGPAGSSQASAAGISWEGDPVNTAFTVTPPGPVSPLQLFAGLITVLAAVPIARRTQRIKL